MEQTLLAIVLAPLVASIIAGLFGRAVGRAGAHSVTILGVAISFVLSLKVLWACCTAARYSTALSIHGW